jgi:hypothetical protein
MALVGTIGAVSLGAVTTAVTPAWGTSETRVAGNTLVLWVAVHGSATLPTFSANGTGWAVAVQRAGTTMSVTAFVKIATGSDTAPTLAAITSGYIQAQLAEFTDDIISVTPDRTGVNSGTTTPIVATTAGVDVAVGDLVLVVGAAYYSAAATKTLTHTVTGGATTITSTNNNGTSLARHYNFGYGWTTSKAAADSDSFAQTTTSITGGAVGIASLKQLYTGTGAIARPSANSGSGTETFSGTGDTALPSASSGSGSETFSGSGDTARPSASAGTGLAGVIGGGDTALPSASAGTGSQIFTGSGSTVSAASAIAGAGSQIFTGTGAFTSAASASAGSGAESFTGTGATARPSASSGSGSETFSGSGSMALPSASAGVGTYTPLAITGTGTWESPGGTPTPTARTTSWGWSS